MTTAVKVAHLENVRGRWELKAAPEALPVDAWDWTSERPGSDTDAQGCYRAVAVLNRGLNLVCNAVANMPFEIRRDETVVDASAGYENKVGFFPTPRRLLWLMQAASYIFGYSYLWRERKGRALVGLRYLLPTSVTPVLDAEVGLKGFVRTVGARRIDCGLDDIVYHWRPDPFVELGPATSTPVTAALAAAGVLLKADDFAGQFFARGAIKATLLTVEGSMPPQAERERLKAWWERVIAGIRNAFAAEVVNAAVKPIVIGDGIAELANVPLADDKRKDVAVALGVPMSILFSDTARGLGGGGVATQDDLSFYGKTIVPEASLLEETLNVQVFQPLGYEFHFLPDTLDVFQEDEAQRAQSLGTLVAALADPLAEVAMSILGYELTPEQDARLRELWAEKAAVSATAQAKETTQANEASETDEGENDAVKGGSGSGNFGHAGRPGQVGGSLPGAPTMSYHAVQRMKERKKFSSVRDALNRLASMQTPNADWYMELRRGGRLDGYMVGYDGVVKTVLGPWYDAAKLRGEVITLKAEDNMPQLDIRRSIEWQLANWTDDMAAALGVKSAADWDDWTVDGLTALLLARYGEEEEEDAAKAYAADLEKWRRKCLKAGRPRPFESDVLPADLIEFVLAELGDAPDEARIKAVFAAVQENGWRPEAVKESAGGHEPEVLALTCPLCGAVGVERYADHGGLCVCQTCGATFDPEVLLKTAAKGGPGSGNFGHRGRPGQIGGSLPGSGQTAVGPGDELHTERQVENEGQLEQAVDVEQLRELVSTREWQRFDEDDGDLRSATELWFDMLEENDVDGIKYYTGRGYRSINQSLRGGTTPSDYDQENITKLDQALSKAPILENDIVVYRGISSNDVQFWQPGRLMHDKGFVSTTVREKTALSWRIAGAYVKIYVPAGKRATYIDGKSIHSTEQEFLLPRDSKFFVLGQTGNEIEAVLLP